MLRVEAMYTLTRSVSFEVAFSAAERRQVVARGASPGFWSPNDLLSPVGATGEGTLRFLSPLRGLNTTSSIFPGLTPRATSFRPYGTAKMRNFKKRERGRAATAAFLAYASGYDSAATPKSIA